jgi:hypothetical protein
MSSKLKKVAGKYLVAVMAFGVLATTAQAISVDIFVDSSPNVFGSSSYAGWWANAKATAADGTFVNMANSVNPLNSGTTSFEVEDHVVYSFGDLGRRLNFVYWIGDETIASLQSQDFQISMNYEWDGIEYDLYDEYYGQTWITPGSQNWTEFNGGVVGSAAFGWWGAYDVNTQEALDADFAAWRPYFGDITLHTRTSTENGPSLKALAATCSVPDAGSSCLLLGGAMALLGVLRRKLA